LASCQHVCHAPPPIKKIKIEHVYHALIKKKLKIFKTPLPRLWFQKIGKISPVYTIFCFAKKIPSFLFSSGENSPEEKKLSLSC